MQTNPQSLLTALRNTLNPALTNHVYQQLSSFRQQANFSVQLLLISDNTTHDIQLRQSALIYLKNLIVDHCQGTIFLPVADLQTIKQSILEALIRNVHQRKLTPTAREIVHILAKKYLPNDWPIILPAIVTYLKESGDLATLLGSLEALKAIYAVCGQSITQQIALSNLCNKTMLPLLSLVSKLFQNYSPQTSILLLNAFKILSTAIYFHLPQIIILNLHSWLIFVKKILDIPLQDHGMFKLKKVCLRVLYIIYQRHVNGAVCRQKAFAQSFHTKYTTSFVQTLMLQLIGNKNDNTQQHKQQPHQQIVIDLIRLSLSTLAYINREHRPSAQLINNYRQVILRICLSRFRLPLNCSYNNYSECRSYLTEYRLHLKEFLFSLIRSQQILDQQHNSATSILNVLSQQIASTDPCAQQLSLYLLAELSTQIQSLDQPLEETMLILVLNCVQFATEVHHASIRGAVCEVIAAYQHLTLPNDQLTPIAQTVYDCLTGSTVPNSNSTAQHILYMKIQATKAFNSLLKYEQIVQFIFPFVKDILAVYTNLLEVQLSVIKSLEELLGHLEGSFGTYAEDLVKMLASMFEDYCRMYLAVNEGDIGAQGDNQYYGETDEADDELQNEQDQPQSNYQAAAKACIASIRQILQSLAQPSSQPPKHPKFSQSTHLQLQNTILYIFSDSQQLYLQQGFNILNLVLYSNDQHVVDKYLPIIMGILYTLLGLPNEVIVNCQHKQDQFSQQYLQLLKNLCVQPDLDFLENSIGCLRNFIVKCSNHCRLQQDPTNITLLDYLLKSVQQVHENTQGTSTQTTRSIILTLYTTLIEYHLLSSTHLQHILDNLFRWLTMQEQIIKQCQQPYSQHKNYIYTPIYLQIVMVAMHTYPEARNISLQQILMQLNNIWDRFRCDYQLARVLVGLADIFGDVAEGKLSVEGWVIGDLLNKLPNAVARVCQLRLLTQTGKGLIDPQMDDQAEQQKLFGDDDNSIVQPWNTGTGQFPTQISQNQLQLGAHSEQNNESTDWQDEFNKYYESPYDRLDQLNYLRNALIETGFIQNIVDRLTLERCFENAPCKFK